MHFNLDSAIARMNSAEITYLAIIPPPPPPPHVYGFIHEQPKIISFERQADCSSG